MTRLMLGLGIMCGCGVSYALFERPGMALLAVCGFGLALWGLDAVERDR